LIRWPSQQYQRAQFGSKEEEQEQDED